jgi:predicted DNA-binding transcriptional regulator AlpA
VIRSAGSSITMWEGHIPLLSSSDVMKRLGITKVTLYKWVQQKKLKARRHKIGPRVYLGFDEKEVGRVKASMVTRREKGKPLIRS